MSLVIGLVAGFIGGFITGILVGRKNKNTVETAVAEAKVIAGNVKNVAK